MRWLLTSKRLKKEPKGQLPGQWRVQKHRAQEPQGGESAEKPVTSEASAKKSWGWGLGTVMLVHVPCAFSISITSASLRLTCLRASRDLVCLRLCTFL